MCLDLPRVEYGKAGVSNTEMDHARKRNQEIAETIEQKIAEAKVKEIQNKKKREAKEKNK